jgi:predicted glycoside hydrolase/deacetylase ChbG (UPF0249 family)
MTCGLLIVNADDWGGFREGTDAIEGCFRAGSISSTTAMVHMADSARAAELAREHGLPVGLHLNFSEPFNGPQVPVQVRERQRRLCGHFAPISRRRWLLSPDPAVHRLVADGIRDQCEEFHQAYGREPTHIDSHHHVHVCPDVFLSRALERGARVRQTLSPVPQNGRGLMRLGWRAKHELLARRFVTTARFWHVRELSPGDGAVPLAYAAAVSARCPVELVVHPSFPAEQQVLRSEGWLNAIEEAPLRSYAALGPAARSRR